MKKLVDKNCFADPAKNVGDHVFDQLGQEWIIEKIYDWKFGIRLLK